MEKYDAPDFTHAQVYAEWCRINEMMWKLDSDQRTSSIKLVERHGEEVENIPVPDENGIAVVAFALKYALDEIGEETEEIAIDGTCE